MSNKKGDGNEKKKPQTVVKKPDKKIVKAATPKKENPKPGTVKAATPKPVTVTADAPKKEDPKPQSKGFGYYFNNHTIRGRANMAAGGEELKGLGRYFNGSTIAGRANVAKATYASIGLLIMYFSLKPKKK